MHTSQGTLPRITRTHRSHACLPRIAYPHHTPSKLHEMSVGVGGSKGLHRAGDTFDADMRTARGSPKQQHGDRGEGQVSADAQGHFTVAHHQQAWGCRGTLLGGPVSAF